MRAVKTSTMVVVGLVLVLTVANAAWADVLGYWNFNEYATSETINTGSALLDASGNQRHMRTAGGSVTSVAGATGGTAIQFTSSSRGEFTPGVDFGDDLVASALDFNFGSTDSFTIEAEVKLGSSSLGAFFSKGFNSGAEKQYYVWYDAPNSRLYGLAWDGTNYGEADANPEVISLNTWHHVALVRDKTAGTLSTYVDGMLAATATDSSGDLSTAGYFSVNTQNSNGQWYSSDVAMDFVRVSNVALSPSQFLTTDIPEPSTLVLLGMGLFGLLAYAWRKRR